MWSSGELWESVVLTFLALLDGSMLVCLYHIVGSAQCVNHWNNLSCLPVVVHLLSQKERVFDQKDYVRAPNTSHGRAWRKEQTA